MNHVDCVIKRDVYPHKLHSCSENVRGISFFVLKISGVHQKEIFCDFSDIKFFACKMFSIWFSSKNMLFDMISKICVKVFSPTSNTYLELNKVKQA